VLTWAELETAAPDITARGRELLERFQFVFVGTLTKDGSPRVNPCEAYVIDGHLLLNMMPRSLKALDLLRDPRIYVHTPVTSKEASESGEFKLAGSAPVLEDVGLRRKLDDLFWQMIQWRRPRVRARAGTPLRCPRPRVQPRRRTRPSCLACYEPRRRGQREPTDEADGHSAGGRRDRVCAPDPSEHCGKPDPCHNTTRVATQLEA
jgi:hypothetical protein